MKEGALFTKMLQHPCFNGCGGKFSRIHLPVAPGCNIQCNYCVRKFDCPNESRPGVCASVLSPEEALERFRRVKREIRNLTVAGIAGPGDTLANFEQTRKTFELIRREDSGIILCLSTNGLLLPRYIPELVALNLSHLTVTINAVDPAIGKEIISFVDFNGERLTGEEAAALLINNQLEGLARAAEAGLVCKINCVMLKGINEGHIPELIEKVKSYGACLTNIMQLIPVQGSVFENMPLVSNQELSAMRKQCETILPQMYHCKQCRADAVGPLHQDVSRLYAEQEEETFSQAPACKGGDENEEAADKPLIFAVASRDGKLVDQHFGHAEEFFLYAWDNGKVSFVERRRVLQFCQGEAGCYDHDSKIAALIETLAGCAGVISMRIGEAPRSALESRGIRVYMTYNKVEEAVKTAAEHCMANKNEILLPIL
ncbi:MAG: nitrogenase cofactor biosynthesis protein NifB [Treponema sp.]|jgi:nitrogenase cofactor biosynthesis protein NifB|nr:nitrogenase cofactor biosynthesis protein NifB [Treponema sp.]